MGFDDGRRVPVNLSPSAGFPKFRFWSHERFMNCLLEYRTLFSRGRVRGGKTLLCTALAYEMVRSGYVERCWANYGMRFASPVVPPLQSGVMVLDEAAEFFDARDFSAGRVKEFRRYLGKLELWMLCPSADSIDVRARALTIEVKWHLPGAWVYEWWLESGATKDKGKLVLLRPEEIFSCFTTKTVTRKVTPDAGFADALDVTIELERAALGGWNGLDFFLPWWRDGEYIPEREGVPYSESVADEVREAWRKRFRKSKQTDAVIVGNDAMNLQQVNPKTKVPFYPE